jgi:hypothetical protein
VLVTEAVADAEGAHARILGRGSAGAAPAPHSAARLAPHSTATSAWATTGFAVPAA